MVIILGFFPSYSLLPPFIHTLAAGTGLDLVLRHRHLNGGASDFIIASHQIPVLLNVWAINENQLPWGGGLRRGNGGIYFVLITIEKWG